MYEHLNAPPASLQPAVVAYVICKYMPWLNTRVDIHRVKTLAQAELLLAEQLDCAQEAFCTVRESDTARGLFHVEFPCDDDNYDLFIRSEAYGFSLN